MFVKRIIGVIIITFAVTAFSIVNLPATSYAVSTECGDPNGTSHYTPAIDIGCQHRGNAIGDMLFAIIRLLSDGVGLIVIASIIVGGIMYITSEGNPQQTAKAVTRMKSAVFALFLYIFGYALLNYLIPGMVLH